MTDVVSVYKAQPVGETEAADLRLVAVEEFPDYEDRDAGRAAHDIDAERIVRALEASLPGGTLDTVMWMMLRSRSSRLRTPVRKPGKTAELTVTLDNTEAVFVPAKDGDTPGELVPGEGEAPQPIRAGTPAEAPGGPNA